MAPPPDAILITTPSWLRVPALLLLIALAIYFLGGFHYALRGGRPAWVSFGVWSMFTTHDPNHLAVEAEGRVQGRWQALDLPTLFPYRWESGHRYQRRAIRRSKRNLRALAAATCHRAGPQVRAVRFREVRWRHTVGSFEQPRRNARVHELGTFACEGAP